MLYQSSADLAAGMQARLQKAGVTFNKAMRVPKADLIHAWESDEAFSKLLRRLLPRTDK